MTKPSKSRMVSKIIKFTLKDILLEVGLPLLVLASLFILFDMFRISQQPTFEQSEAMIEQQDKDKQKLQNSLDRAQKAIDEADAVLNKSK